MTARCVVCDGELGKYFLLNPDTREVRHLGACEELPAGWLSLDAISSRLVAERSDCRCENFWSHQGFTCPVMYGGARR